jgi:hypothetical protein
VGGGVRGDAGHTLSFLFLYSDELPCYGPFAVEQRAKKGAQESVDFWFGAANEKGKGPLWNLFSKEKERYNNG